MFVDIDRVLVRVVAVEMLEVVELEAVVELEMEVDLVEVEEVVIGMAPWFMVA